MGRLLIDCCLWNPLAIFAGLVSILLFPYVMQCFLVFKNSFVDFFGLFSYSCLHLTMAFLIHS